MQEPWTAQIGRLIDSSPDSRSGEAILDPDWVILLWQRGLHHENPQVTMDASRLCHVLALQFVRASDACGL